MIKHLTLASAAIALLTTPAMAAKKTGEEELAEMLEGREAGEPTRCIRTLRSSGNLQVIDKTAIVYKRGDTVWVNKTRNPDQLDEDDILVIRKFGNTSQLCRLDNITTADRFNGFFTGAVFLTDFVPYKTVETEEEG
ncbi:hypothetical protein ACRAQ7_03955 [Erythrobacter sp. W53]|uniref:hypothetical protein n=1 Tax=Erythrobacteraceae TaxID=335929 RepID=UPI0036D21804